MTRTQPAPWRYLMVGLLVSSAIGAVWRITQQPLAADFGAEATQEAQHKEVSLCPR